MSIDAWAQVAIFTRTWTRCGRCTMLGQVVLWVEFIIQRGHCPIFVSGVGLPDIHEYSAGLWVINRPLGNGASHNVSAEV